MSTNGDALTQIDAAVLEFGHEEQSLRSYLEQLSAQLAMTCSRAGIHCSGRTIVLERYSEDDWTFGYIYCDERGLRVAHGYSGDTMMLEPGEEVSYSVKELKECPFPWLKSITSREVIEELLTVVREEMLKQTDSLRSRLVELASVALPADRAAAADFQQVASELGFDRIAADWRRAQIETISDPESAVRSACVMIESVCKHILEAKNLLAEGELAVLIKNTRTALVLDPDTKIDEPLTRVVSGLSNAITAIGTLRNRASDAHGQGKTPLAINSSHARLVVNGAGAIVTYFLDRWKSVKGRVHDSN